MHLFLNVSTYPFVDTNSILNVKLYSPHLQWPWYYRHSQNSLITIDWLPNLPMLKPCKDKLIAATFAHQGNGIICKEAPGLGVVDQYVFSPPTLYCPSPSTLFQLEQQAQLPNTQRTCSAPSPFPSSDNRRPVCPFHHPFRSFTFSFVCTAEKPETAPATESLL